MEFTCPQERERLPFELFYQPLLVARPGLSFPCDAAGRVDLDVLSDGDRRNYLYARVVTGREFAWPVVRPARAAAVLVS